MPIRRKAPSLHPLSHTQVSLLYAFADTIGEPLMPEQLLKRVYRWGEHVQTKAKSRTTSKAFARCWVSAVSRRYTDEANDRRGFEDIRKRPRRHSAPKLLWDVTFEPRP